MSTTAAGLELHFNDTQTDLNALKEADQMGQATESDAEILARFVRGFSIEVMPRTAEKIADFREILPQGTRVYIAHIEGTPVDQMIGAAKRIAGEGFPVMPHFTARAIRNQQELSQLIDGYQSEAGVRQALVLAGGITKPVGKFHSSLQLLRTELFDMAGFTDLHVAGHPEGNKDIDPDGGFTVTDASLREKQAFARNTDARMTLATQFVFDAAPVISWSERIAADGITLPIHVGVSGPAKIQTLIKFALACGVGPSLRVLQRRAADVSKMLKPIEPTGIARELALYKLRQTDSKISNIHVFPLGGIRIGAEWARRHAAVLPAR